MPPWTNDINPAQPADNDPASQGDDQIRGLKAAVIERFLTRSPNFPSAQPMRWSAFDVGTMAARPATPDIDGQGYFATDTDPKKLFIGVAGAWVEFAGAGGGVPSITAPSNMAIQNLSSCAGGSVPTYLQRVTWQDTVVNAQTRIIVNGTLTTTKNYDVETHDLALAPGVYVIGLQHIKDNVVSETTTQVLTVTNPCTTGGALTAPTGLNVTNTSTCFNSTPFYDQLVSWVNSNASAETRVLVDGVEAALKAPGVTQHLLTLQPGTYTIGVQHKLDGVLSDTPTKQLIVTNPCTTTQPLQPLRYFTVTDDTRCDPGPTAYYGVKLEISRQDNAAQVRIKMNGTQIYLLSTSYPDANPIFHAIVGGSPGTYTFEATQVVGGVDGPAITRQITLPDPCSLPQLQPPFDPRATENGTCIGALSDNKAMVLWTNTEASAKVRLYREPLGEAAVMIAELAVGVAQYLDEDITMDQTYNYWVTHYDPAIPFESIESPTAVYYAANLCPPE